MKINLAPKSVFLTLLAIIFMLLIANILGIISKFFLGYGSVKGLVPLFNFNTEKNIPTLFSVVLLLISALLFLIIANHHKKLQQSYWPWAGLSAIFLFLSIDEIAVLHERLSGSLHETLDTSGVFFFAWIIPYGLALVVLGLVYLNFLRQLPSRTRNLLILSGAIFVTGAIGFEMLGGQHADQYGYKTFVYSIFYTFEELFEMLGVTLLIYTLLLYITNNFVSFTLTIQEKESIEAKETVNEKEAFAA